MIIVGLIMAALTIYNYFSTPRTEDANEGREIVGTQSKFGAVFASFFFKTNWDRTGLYIIIPFGESQLLKMLTPSLLMISVGGMGLTTQDVGIIYGTFGVLALTIGGIIMEL
jgi:PAT family beta-lactamase induction signal transducer AmpG